MTTPTNFSIDDMPADKPPASSADKPRRGRPPGSRNKPKPVAGATDAATLRQAVATMDTLYQVTAAGLLMAGLTETAAEFAEKSTQLSKANEDALRAAPRLAKMIAGAGSVGGATTFIVSHVMVFAGVARTAQAELANRAKPAPVQGEPTP